MDAGGTRRVLVTGAAGRIGTALYQELRGAYAFRLTDRDPSLLERETAPGDEASLLDITDRVACLAACAGVDTVVHLAADPWPDADFVGSLLPNNLLGTYAIFDAAARAGCRRVIFASSVHAVMGYTDGWPVDEADPVWPVNMYGVSKCFGEATARAFVSMTGLSAIALRIGAYEAPWIAEEPTPENLSMFLSARDLNQLIRRCIEAEGIDFAILHAISDNREKRLSIEAARQLVGYAPVDDGFALYGGGT